VTHFAENDTFVTRVVDTESGEAIDSRYTMTGTTPQQRGSEQTYFRRYSMIALFNLPSEDDDGNACSNNAPTSNANTTTGTNTLDFIKSSNIDDLFKAINEGVIQCASADDAIKLAEKKYKVAKWAEEEIREK
jgi:hypothetical protein